MDEIYTSLLYARYGNKDCVLCCLQFGAFFLHSFSSIIQHLVLAYQPKTQWKFVQHFSICSFFFISSTPHSLVVGFFLLCCIATLPIFCSPNHSYDASWRFSCGSPIVYFMLSGLHAINTHENMLTSRLSEKPKINWPHDKSGMTVKMNNPLYVKSRSQNSCV